MAKLNLYNLVVPAYYNLIRFFIKMLGGNFNVPKRYTIGGSRKGGKTRAVLLIFSILFSLAFPNTMVLIATEKASGSADTWKTLNDFIDKVLKVRAKVRSSKQGSEMEICFTNGSTIYVRSLRQSDSKKIALKGLPRPTDLQNAIVIADECNTWPEKWFGLVNEAIVAENIMNFRLFNTDHIKQHIVAYLQEHLPENVTTMKSIGNMVDVHEVNGVLEYFQRTNTLVTWDVLPEATKKQIIADDLANPKRGRVARWGLNGRDGKLLYHQLQDKHFINSSEIAKYKRFKKLPHQLFKYYRVGIDEGHSSDKMVISMKGMTYSGRLIWLEGKSWTPPKDGDLNIASITLQMAILIKQWSSMYPNMKYQGVRIRTEWAGNGVAIKQGLERELDKTNITYTSNKAKKSTGNSKTKKELGANKSTQPQLEGRAAMKNYLLGYNQLLWWNAPQEIKDEYEGAGRDEEGLIIDADNHWRDAEDYLEIPEHEDMMENQPRTTFAEELDECILENNL